MTVRSFVYAMNRKNGGEVRRDMQRLVMKLSEREMFSLDRVLRETAAVFELTVVNETAEEFVQLKADQYAPSEWTFDLARADRNFASIKINSYPDLGDKDPSWRLELTHKADEADAARTYFSAVKRQFGVSIPPVFNEPLGRSGGERRYHRYRHHQPDRGHRKSHHRETGTHRHPYLFRRTGSAAHRQALGQETRQFCPQF